MARKPWYSGALDEDIIRKRSYTPVAIKIVNASEITYESVSGKGTLVIDIEGEDQEGRTYGARIRSAKDVIGFFNNTISRRGENMVSGDLVNKVVHAYLGEESKVMGVGADHITDEFNYRSQVMKVFGADK